MPMTKRLGTRLLASTSRAARFIDGVKALQSKQAR
jgi:hypothetical protein